MEKRECSRTTKIELASNIKINNIPYNVITNLIFYPLFSWTVPQFFPYGSSRNHNRTGHVGDVNIKCTWPKTSSQTYLFPPFVHVKTLNPSCLAPSSPKGRQRKTICLSDWWKAVLFTLHPLALITCAGYIDLLTTIIPAIFLKKCTEMTGLGHSSLSQTGQTSLLGCQGIVRWHQDIVSKK